MTEGTPLTITLSSPEATARLAGRLARRLGAGDTLLLSGPIGAGKTHFARSLIQARLSAAGRLEEVPSPTFTLVQTYDDGEVEIWHADLYRLTGPEEALELGLYSAFTEAICIVEWPDRLAETAPAGALRLDFFPLSETARRLTFSGPADRWSARLSELESADV